MNVAQQKSLTVRNFEARKRETKSSSGTNNVKRSKNSCSPFYSVYNLRVKYFIHQECHSSIFCWKYRSLKLSIEAEQNIYI